MKAHNSSTKNGAYFTFHKLTPFLPHQIDASCQTMASEYPSKGTETLCQTCSQTFTRISSPTTVLITPNEEKQTLPSANSLQLFLNNSENPCTGHIEAAGYSNGDEGASEVPSQTGGVPLCSSPVVEARREQQVSQCSL